MYIQTYIIYVQTYRHLLYIRVAFCLLLLSRDFYLQMCKKSAKAGTIPLSDSISLTHYDRNDVEIFDKSS